MGGAKFEEVAAVALSMAETLLPRWIGGKRMGHEWVGETKANGGPGNSWCINLTTGHWIHGAGNEKGLDMISMYAAYNHLKQTAARVEVENQCGLSNGHSQTVLEHVKKPPEAPPEAIPDDPPEPRDHPKYGAPSATHKYGYAFWQLRYDFIDEAGKPGKLFQPLTWRGHWAVKAYPEPRPLYRLAELRKYPDLPVLIVEGEKCADLAAVTLGAMLPITWSNGSNAVKKSDWSPMEGRDVLIWPDADEAGAKAAATVAERCIAAGAARVRVLDVSDQVKQGWDIADAIEAGWASKAIVEWAKGRTRVIYPREVTEPPAHIESGEQSESTLVNWHSLGLDLSEGGTPFATIANASTIMQMHPALRGKIWFDSFRDKIYTTIGGGMPRQWTDVDEVNLTVFIQQSMRLPKFELGLVTIAAAHAARCIARNSLTDFLDSLTWDGIPRLETWLADTLGCENNDYSQAVGANWPISMIARAYVPGCKVDTMPVLEGTQGKSKSTFLEILGDPWYGAVSMAFGDKDFLQAIQGRWLIEIPDMTGFSKREHTHILATITIRSDIYRPSYGRHTVEHPRVTVFAASSENDEYLKDARGRRRYWPLRCTHIDLDALRAQRDQIFAEARDRYRDGVSWWEVPDSANEEQLERVTGDLWTERVMTYVDNIWNDPTPSARIVAITSTRILSDAIELPVYKQTDSEKQRIARIMRENGWTQVRDQYGRRWKKRAREERPT